MPSSGATLAMNIKSGVSGLPSWSKAKLPSVELAAATAAGLVADWSEIRLLMVRGAESTT
ncbi:hypothetical protein D3C80_1982180 [compost metagenome]